MPRGGADQRRLCWYQNLRSPLTPLLRVPAVGNAVFAITSNQHTVPCLPEMSLNRFVSIPGRLLR